MFRIGLVHAYAVVPGPRPGTWSPGAFMLEFCRMLALERGRLNLIVLLGGWHTRTDPSYILAMPMQDLLVRFGVAPASLLVWSEMECLKKYMPPRGTVEEALLAKKVVEARCFTDFQEVCYESFILKEAVLWLQNIHKAIGLCHAVTGVETGVVGDAARRDYERLELLSRKDPLQTAEEFARKREGRTFAPPGPRCVPLLEEYLSIL